MDFGFRNMEFVQDLSYLTREVAASTFRGPGPRMLCHYTRKESSKKIIATRTLWATCLTEQSDTTELLHGIALVEGVAMELLDKQSNPFVQEVLSGLADFMRSRRSMLFVTCFCGGAASPFHTETYGSVCFRFTQPHGGPPPLTLKRMGGERWFSPVIYGEKDQRRAIKHYLSAASNLLIKHLTGSFQRGRVEWMASTPRRDLGLCLLTIVAAFKRKKFYRDREWRLIFSPPLSLSNSAPNLIDETFSALVESQPRRHVSLRREVAFPPRDGEVWPPLFGDMTPYDDVLYLSPPSRLAKVVARIKGQ
jgi:hypothetical protein